ncbi:MAG: cell envelope integrity protein TolA [Gammaproteobacteria bacterium]|nr:cell envelope integrity protein TolA [Gammaproteobacteria bacterium]
MGIVRDYAFPFALAVLLHGGVLALLFQNWQPETEELRLYEPRVMVAKVIVMEQPVRKRPVPVTEQPKPAPAPAAAPLPRPKPKPKTPPPPPPSVEQPPQADPEEERRVRAEQELQDRLRELSAQSMQLALAGEVADLRDMEADAETMSYAAKIQQAISAAWSRPPSARLGMQARLRVDLVPSGDVWAVTILESSGNSAFDRSAEVAVRKVGRFEVPKETRLFERNFRRFTLLFKPEDLLR